RVSNQRANTTSVMVNDDVHVSGMLKHQYLAQSIADMGGCVEFRRQALYKVSWCGSQVVLAERWQPSGKTCLGCGWVDEQLEVGDRLLHCRTLQRPDCGLVLGRV